MRDDRLDEIERRMAEIEAEEFWLDSTEYEELLGEWETLTS